MQCLQEPKCDEVKQLREEVPKLKEEISKLFKTLGRAQSIAITFGHHIEENIPSTKCPFRLSPIVSGVLCRSSDNCGFHFCEDCILNFIEGKPTADER